MLYKPCTAVTRGAQQNALQNGHTWGTGAVKGQILSLFRLQTILSSSFPAASKLCLPIGANTKTFRGQGWYSARGRTPPGLGLPARSQQGRCRGHRKVPAARGSPGGLADAVPSNLDVPSWRGRKEEHASPADAKAAEAWGYCPQPACLAFCPLGSSELASRCFYSLRRHPNPATSPRPTHPGCEQSTERAGTATSQRRSAGAAVAVVLVAARPLCRGAAATHSCHAAGAIPPKASSCPSPNVPWPVAEAVPPG